MGALPPLWTPFVGYFGVRIKMRLPCVAQTIQLVQSNSDKLDMAGTAVKIGLSRQDFQQKAGDDSKLSNFRTLLAFFSFLNCRKTQFAPRLFALVTQWHIGILPAFTQNAIFNT